MKKRVLFVDDERKILDGLQRMLRALRHEWDMAFAVSGPEALEVLDSRPFDIIVSDMRMPGMDGSQLLTHVRERHPEIIRIILSGYSDRETILRSVRVAHQYLNKPCDPETLRSTIARAGALRDFLADEGLLRVLSRIDRLPSVPSLYLEITQALESPDVTVDDICKIISKDVGMTAKVLQMTNSAFFGLPRRVTNLERALGLLGLETIKVLVITVEIFSMHAHASVPGFSVHILWDHSSGVASLAKAIAREEKQDQMGVDDSFTAGMLHDVGKLVLATNLPENYRRVLTLMHEKDTSLMNAEREIFGTTHAEVGGYLMGLWGLPDTIVEAITFHHAPGQCPARAFGPLTAVHVADALDHTIHSGKSPEDAGLLAFDYLAGLNLSERVPFWKAVFEERAQ